MHKKFYNIGPWAFTRKGFTAVINFKSQKVWVVITDGHLHLCLPFAGKAGAYPSGALRHFKLKYPTSYEATNLGKH